MLSFILSETIPLSKKNIISSREDHFSRGTYLIVLSNPDLYGTALSYFVDLKMTQGFDVDMISFRGGNENVEGINGSSSNDLKDYLMDYYNQDSMLEYVLLIGDVNQNSEDYNIPTYEIPSYNENENDQTDYPYTFFDTGEGLDILSPHFFLG